MSEKASLPLPGGQVSPPPRSQLPNIFLGGLLIFATFFSFQSSFPGANHVRCLGSKLGLGLDASNDHDVGIVYDDAWYEDHVECPAQPRPIFPKMTWNITNEEKKASVEKYIQAVRIPTQSFDDNGEPTEDPRWEPFVDFHKWLKSTFPTAWEAADIDFVNTLGLLATFKGSDPSLKPLVLMSHYDVTPAPPGTADRWAHPPFGGYDDGDFIWGRGASDDKGLLVAQWEAITHLLESGFSPRRTLILSHGFDEEEVFARRGQGHIAPFLEKRYGQDSLLMVIDEGTGTSDDMFGAPFALPGMGEKGYMDIIISVGTAGGHSSFPPEHSGIGIMAQIISGLEDNPFPVKLTPSSPILTGMMCFAKYSPSYPTSSAKLLKSEGPKTWPKLAKIFASNSRRDRAMVGTTTAFDVIHGGVKVNALPEFVTGQVNFRIDFSESVASTQKHVAGILGKVAKKNGLNFSPFDGKDGEADLGGRYVKVEVMGLPLEPAPRTPSNNGVWELFAGTVKAALPGPDGAERIVAPFASTGNGDTKVYHNLTKNLYRFSGAPNNSGFNAHTVDERGSIEGYYQILGWVHAIIQTADAYEGEE